MRLRWTPRAEQDLGTQCAFIAKDDPALARRLGEEVFERIEGLARFPYQGRAGRVEGTRELPLPGLPWLAVYAVNDGAIVILRLLHGAQAWPPDEV